MNHTERLSAWTFRRQHLDRSAADPLQALHDVIAVHSTHPPAPLSLLARTPGFEYEEFDVLIQQGQAINFATMRGSVHLQPTEFAPNLLAATKTKPAALRKRLGVDNEEFAHLRAKLLPKLQQPVPGSGIREALDIDDHEFLAIRMVARAGDVLRISTNPRSDRLEYVATEAWLGKSIAGADPDASRTWLAQAYLEAFGPARVTDFAWWLGSSKRDAQAAFDELSLSEIGHGLFLPNSLLAEFQATPDLDATANAILPKWDCYTMAYAPDGRDRLVDNTHLEHAYTTKSTRKGATTGDGFPLILLCGRAVARWTHRFSGQTMTVDIDIFPGETLDIEVLRTRFQEIATLMNCTKATINEPVKLKQSNF